MFEVKVEVKFRYGHRLFENYEGKCSNLHGEYGTAIFYFKKENLNEAGMVEDFSLLKHTIKDWIDSNWDHAFLVNKKDEKMVQFLKDNGFRYYLMEGNPTAELMAYTLFKQFKQEFPSLYKVGLVESDTNAIAYYTEE